MRLWGNFFREVPPRPLKNLLTRAYIKLFDRNGQTVDTRCKTSLGCRERLGTSKTLSAKRFVFVITKSASAPFVVFLFS